MTADEPGEKGALGKTRKIAYPGMHSLDGAIPSLRKTHKPRRPRKLSWETAAKKLMMSGFLGFPRPNPPCYMWCSHLTRSCKPRMMELVELGSVADNGWTTDRTSSPTFPSSDINEGGHEKSEKVAQTNFRCGAR